MDWIHWKFRLRLLPFRKIKFPPAVAIKGSDPPSLCRPPLLLAGAQIDFGHEREDRLAFGPGASSRDYNVGGAHNGLR